jgi:RimJ/RimL family protein N-acetyltransferase
VIETERLTLRPLTADDLDAWFALHSDDRVNRFVGAYSRKQTAARLTHIEKQWAERGHGLYAVELKSSGEFIGRCGLNYWEQFDEIEAGWTFKAETWGRGYATEAARACVEWGFATLDAPYFTAMIRPGNTPSVRVAQRLGFTVRREDALFGTPVTVYGLSRPGHG